MTCVVGIETPDGVIMGADPRKRLRAALMAAERHSAGVRRPWRFASEAA